ncbi:YbaB/EbfC family nucleoid-associated protein [Actinomadura rubrobrunea]|uniref:YbaB/EbfC family nucleoid-associated protein n=1 Tax=Actinomadura rubrobrunea TaxID=115335 RepID=UPI001D042C99|nr:YbaB/EbfC family nucleoid-associated protein [Actinomadura rubrobrunea]
MVSILEVTRVAGFSSAELDRMLTEARKTLESMRQGNTAPRPEKTKTADGDALEGVGEAADGRIKVTAVAGGRLKSVELNPRVMRMSSQELGERLVEAVNAALEDLRAKAATAGAAEGAVDPAALGKQIEEIQNQSLRQMELITQALNDTLAKIGGSR